MLSHKSDTIFYRLAMMILAGVAVIIVLTFRHYGISWDEELQSQYGQAIYDYYVSGFVDRRYNETFNLYLYGGMFDGLAAFFNVYTPVKIYETRHLLNALIGLLGLWGAWRLGRLIGGPRVGLITLVLLVLTPMYYGHMFNNPKDIPFATGVIWSLYYMTKCLRSFPDTPLRTLLFTGVVYGLTLGVRVGGVMVLGYWGLALGLMMLSMIAARSSGLSWLAKAKIFLYFTWETLKTVIPVILIAYAVMLFCWPWAQEAPIENPIKALVQFSDFPQDVEVLLNGVTYRSTQLPWYYIPQYFAVQLPLLQLGLLLAGLALLPLLAMRLPERANRYALVQIVLALIVPVVFVVWHRSALYDAVRHFIFMLPLMAVIEALALGYFWDVGKELLARRASPAIKQTAGAGLGIVLISWMAVQIGTMVSLHPYEYIFINSLEGGVKGGYGHYELDYWGSSFKEATEKLQAIVAQEGGVPAGKIYRLAICGPWSAATIYLPPDYQPVEADQPAEFFLSTTRWQCQDMRPGKEIVRIEHDNAPLSIIKDLRHEKGDVKDKPE